MYFHLKKNFFLHLILFLFSFSLQAEVVKILKVDSTQYPRIQIDVAIGSPHPSFITNKQQTGIELFEIYNNKENKIQITNKVYQSDDTSRLNLVVVFDATKSISKKSFQSARKSARKLLMSLGKHDRSAIYILKNKPELIADVSSNHASQAMKLDTVSRNGKQTRLYDSLYSGLYTARSMATGDNVDLKTKTAVVLFTDGRDEGSFLTDNDCFELTELGRSLSIPVYTILGRSKIRNKKSPGINSYRLLNRLSMKTGGHLWVKSGRHQEKYIFEQIQSMMHRIYKITYRTHSSDSGNWPGNSILLRLVMNRGESSYSAVSGYRVPLTGYLKQNFGRSVAIILGVLLVLALAFLILIIFFIFLSRLSRKKNKENSVQNIKDEDTIPDIVPYIHSRSEIDFEENPSGIGRNSDAGQINPTVQYVHTGFPANTLMDDERKLYMREYNYRLLQLGLREAGEYKKAALVSKAKQATGGSRQYDLFLETTVLGSGRWANIPVHDNTISPVHAKLKKVGDRFVIYDLLSAGGVFVNGKKILRPRGLKDDDEIRIGRTKLYFKAINN